MSTQITSSGQMMHCLLITLANTKQTWGCRTVITVYTLVQGYLYKWRWTNIQRIIQWSYRTSIVNHRTSSNWTSRTSIFIYLFFFKVKPSIFVSVDTSTLVFICLLKTGMCTYTHKNLYSRGVYQESTTQDWMGLTHQISNRDNRGAGSVLQVPLCQCQQGQEPRALPARTWTGPRARSFPFRDHQTTTAFVRYRPTRSAPFPRTKSLLYFIAIVFFHPTCSSNTMNYKQWTE